MKVRILPSEPIYTAVAVEPIGTPNHWHTSRTSNADSYLEEFMNAKLTIRCGDRIRKAEEHSCQNCGKTFLRRVDVKRKTQYCSKECAYKARQVPDKSERKYLRTQTSEYKAAQKLRNSKHYELNKDLYKQRARTHRLANPKTTLLNRARGSAKERNLEFNLTIEDIVIPDKCPALGIALDSSAKPRSYNKPSLDRIDNTKGYVKGNVVVVSWRANVLKRDASIDELSAIASFYKLIRASQGGYAASKTAESGSIPDVRAKTIA